MDENDLEKLKFPIGRFKPPNKEDYPNLRTKWIQSIAQLPLQLLEITQDWSLEKWKTPYRPDGWSALQLIHHVSDSHHQALVRIKLALTEDNPTIKPYHQEKWAELADSLHSSPQAALSILDGTHQKWSLLLKNRKDSDWNRTFYHPEHSASFTIASATALYAWHGEHHLAHLQNM